MSDVLEVITKLQKLKIVEECHLTESETKNAGDEWVAIKENSDSCLAIIGLAHICAFAARLCFKFA